MRDQESPEIDGRDDGAWVARALSVGDVRNGYRLLLGREPESDAVVEQMAGRPLDRGFAAFLTSGEFRSKLVLEEDGVLAAAHEELLGAFDRTLGEWIAESMPLPDTVADAARAGSGRLALIGALFAHPGLREALAGETRDGAADAPTIAAAIGQAYDAAAVIARSDRFDADFYASETGVARPPIEAALHYLLSGERLHARPSRDFDQLVYRAFNPSLAGYRGNLLLHYQRIGRTEGFVLFDGDMSAVHAEQARIIRQCALFDETFYRNQIGDISPLVGDAALHYLVEGEQAGLLPSEHFDPAVYAELHPDVGHSEINRLFHFEQHGRLEKRAHRAVVDDIELPADGIDPARPTILLLLHEATHTGAPILGWNLLTELRARSNVVVVLRNGGSLEDALAARASACIGPIPPEAVNDPVQMARLGRRIAARYRPRYAIANSVETRLVALGLRDALVPIIALVHEFWIGHRPGIRSPFFSRCASIVFPADVVRRSSAHAFAEIGLQNVAILPQGPSTVPPFGKSHGPSAASEPPGWIDGGPRVPLTTLLADRGRSGAPYTVIGLGTIEMRKGVDLFIAAATALKAKHPTLPFRFIWIGGWQFMVGTNYGALLQEQEARAGLDELHFFPPVDDLEPIYARADALFLSSRLDPLPNVGIDAAMRGIPILCFKDASGLAELLLDHPGTADLVVPHLDAGAIADRIAALASDPQDQAAKAQAIGQVARATFDMSRYAREIEALGAAAAAKLARTGDEEALIRQSGLFDPGLYFGSAHKTATMLRGKTAIAAYLDETREINFASPPVIGSGLRRPAVGFNPFVYGNLAPGFPTDGSRDPLAHYVEMGRPAGPWIHDVILLADECEPPLAAPTHRAAGARGPFARLLTTFKRTIGRADVAMHGHFHYTDNIADFMAALAVNETPMDLFLTCSSTASAALLKAATRHYTAGRVTIETGNNVGRDVAPFLRVLDRHVIGHYAFVGHVHGKRSLHTAGYDEDLGNRWRRFLWEHLVGPSVPAADAILRRMRDDPRLGLVFPENDFIIGWERNGASGPALAERMGLPLPLPVHLDFPVGTMFWARPDALRRLTDLRLRDNDYPPEPLPIDGTMLHALERLIPLAAESIGYRYVTTHIPTIKR